MQISRGFHESAGYRGGIVSIGNFDGVHLGHREMLGALRRLADSLSAPAVVLTFDPHPVAILRGSPPPALTTTERKLELLAGCGVDCTIVFPTDRSFLQLSPREFFERIVLGTIEARGLVEGPNFQFGRGRLGTVDTLRSLCGAAGLQLEIVPAVTLDGRTVSSSEVRAALQQGDLRTATAMLGQPYRVRGRVIEGARRGRSLGFPTANVVDVATVLPQGGVYAGRALIGGISHPAAINLGANPTFGESQQKLEVHILDFAGDLYGQLLDVEFLERLRDTRPFGNVDELLAQLREDVSRARTVCAANSNA